VRDPVKNARAATLTNTQAAEIRARLKACSYCDRPIPSLSRIVCPPCALKHGIEGVRGAREGPR
jgi:hypothetical protein